jgi:hypothetical protein
MFPAATFIAVPIRKVLSDPTFSHRSLQASRATLLEPVYAR